MEKVRAARKPCADDTELRLQAIKLVSFERRRAADMVKAAAVIYAWLKAGAVPAPAARSKRRAEPR